LGRVGHSEGSKKERCRRRGESRGGRSRKGETVSISFVQVNRNSGEPRISVSSSGRSRTYVLKPPLRKTSIRQTLHNERTPSTKGMHRNASRGASRDCRRRRGKLSAGRFTENRRGCRMRTTIDIEVRRKPAVMQASIENIERFSSDGDDKH
jgi:hypothetical protein